jgi:hypothetical protein
MERHPYRHRAWAVRIHHVVQIHLQSICPRETPVLIELFGDWRMQRKADDPCKRCERPWTHAVWNIETHYLTHLCEECARDLVSTGDLPAKS